MKSLACCLLWLAAAANGVPLRQEPAGQAGAGERAPLPVCELAPGSGDKLVQEPCRPAPGPVSRRAVRQTVERMPSATPSPAATPGLAPGMAQVAPVPPAVPLPRPLPIGSCDAGGCRDAAGNRHNSGVGNTTIDRNGKVCVRNGAFLQCN